MTETGWSAIGRIARARRERLGLNQDELAARGGPRVATVGKFERGRDSFPLRTQHQMEAALGWRRGVVEDFVRACNSEDADVDLAAWEADLIAENVPDLGRESPRADLSWPYPAADFDPLEVRDAAETFTNVFRLIHPGARVDALRASISALLPFLSPNGATILGQQLRAAFPPEGGDGDAEQSRGSAPITAVPNDDLYADEAAYDPEKE